MFLSKTTKNFIIVFTSLVAINLLILAIISFLSWSYLVGFCLGVITTSITNLINIFFINRLLEKKHSKLIAILISVIRFFIWLVIVSLIIILILFVNHLYNKNTIESSWNWIDGIFNLFFFIYGSSIIMMSTIISELFLKIKKSKRKGGMS